MKHCLPLLLLLAAQAVGAADGEAPRPSSGWGRA
jgi:hypothetical protein